MIKFLATALLTFTCYFASAQLNVNINIGSQPLWGPVGYDRVDYYYLPDVDAYYYVPQKQFIYLSNGKWTFSVGLPASYKNYDLYSGYKVVINTPEPYHHHKTHKIKYAKYKSHKNKQTIIIHSNEPKYYVVEGHPKKGKGHEKDHNKHNGGGGKGHKHKGKR